VFSLYALWKKAMVELWTSNPQAEKQQFYKWIEQLSFINFECMQFHNT
jgi:hypothetical protein